MYIKQVNRKKESWTDKLESIHTATTNDDHTVITRILIPEKNIC